MDLKTIFSEKERVKIVDTGGKKLVTSTNVTPKTNEWIITAVYPFYLVGEALVRDAITDELRTEKKSISIGDLVQSGYARRMNVSSSKKEIVL